MKLITSVSAVLAIALSAFSGTKQGVTFVLSKAMKSGRGGTRTRNDGVSKGLMSLMSGTGTSKPIGKGSNSLVYSKIQPDLASGGGSRTNRSGASKSACTGSSSLASGAPGAALGGRSRRSSKKSSKNSFSYKGTTSAHQADDCGCGKGNGSESENMSSNSACGKSSQSSQVEDSSSQNGGYRSVPKLLSVTAPSAEQSGLVSGNPAETTDDCDCVLTSTITPTEFPTEVGIKSTDAPLPAPGIPNGPTETPTAASVKRPVSQSVAPMTSPTGVPMSAQFVPPASSHKSAIIPPVASPLATPTNSPAEGTQITASLPHVPDTIYQQSTNLPDSSPTIAPVMQPVRTPVASLTRMPTTAMTRCPIPNQPIVPQATSISVPMNVPAVSPVASPAEFLTSAPTDGDIKTTSSLSPVPGVFNGPSATKTIVPMIMLTLAPTAEPTKAPAAAPTMQPTLPPTVIPTISPMVKPTAAPTMQRLVSPTMSPIPRSAVPKINTTSSPTQRPSLQPIKSQTSEHTAFPSKAPTPYPIQAPTTSPTKEPTVMPVKNPSVQPVAALTDSPSHAPTAMPTEFPGAGIVIPPKAPTAFLTRSPVASTVTNPFSLSTTIPTQGDIETIDSVTPTPTIPDQPTCDRLNMTSCDCPELPYAPSGQPTSAPNKEIKTTASFSPAPGISVEASTTLPATKQSDEPTEAPNGDLTQHPTSTPTDVSTFAPAKNPTLMPINIQTLALTPPDALDDTSSTLGDTPVTIPVLKNDTDVDGNIEPTSVTVVSQPDNGNATVSSNGTIIYKPKPGFNGSDTFVYEVCDTTNLCDEATVTVTVTVVSMLESPVANDDTATTSEDVSVNVIVLVNDSDADGSLVPGSVEVVELGPMNGTAILLDNGTIHYTPDANFSGKDTFVYQVCDNDGLCNKATVTVTVTSVAEATLFPTSAPTMALTINPTLQPTPSPTSAPTMAPTMNPTLQPIPSPTSAPTTGPTMSPTVQPTSSPTSTPTIGPTMSPTVQPTYSPTSIPTKVPTLFPIVAPSPAQTLSPVMRTLAPTPKPKISPALSPPQAIDDFSATPQETLVVIPVSDNDVPGNGALMPEGIKVTVLPQNGVASPNTNGTIAYTPALGFVGQDAFEYEICDANNLCDKAIVIVTVLAPPVAKDDFAVTSENTIVTIPVLDNDNNGSDGGTLYIKNVTNSDHGVVVVNPSGNVSYTPEGGFSGADTFEYTVCKLETSQLCDTAVVTVIVKSETTGCRTSNSTLQNVSNDFAGWIITNTLSNTSCGDNEGGVLPVNRVLDTDPNQEQGFTSNGNRKSYRENDGTTVVHSNLRRRRLPST